MNDHVAQQEANRYLEQAITHPFAEPRLSGKQVASMMRRCGKTIRSIAGEQGLTLKRVRHVRIHGVQDGLRVSEWIKFCTGTWPKAPPPPTSPPVKVRGFWGATFPMDTGVIIDTCPMKGCLIRWDQGSPALESWHRIDGPYKGYGSPIGVYIDAEA